MKTEDIINENLGIVRTLAIQYARKTADMTPDDFIGEGNVALVIAARKWKPEKEPVFAHYATYHIRKAMEKIMPHGEIKKNLSEKLSAGRPYTHEGAEQKELGEDMHRRIMQLTPRERAVICHYYGVEGQEMLNMTEIAARTGYTRERVRQIRKTAERKMRRLITLTMLLAMLFTAQPTTAQQPMGNGGQPPMNGAPKDGGKRPMEKKEKAKKQKAKPELPKKFVVKTIYLYGVGFSPLDSVVYFTDEQRLDSMVIEKKTKFLDKRAVLSEQLTNHLTSIGEKKYTCAIIFDTNLKKLDKRYLKHADRYKKLGYTIKAADGSQFMFSR